MSPAQLEIFSEIRRLLAEGYRIHAEQDDGMHKPSDGLCEVSYPTAYWDGEEGCGGIEADGLMIYSYVLGPSRAHHFYRGTGRGDYATFYSRDPFKTALGEVRKWLAEQQERINDQ